MINKQQAILDGTIEPGGIQSSNNGGNLNGASGFDIQMMDPQNELGQVKNQIDNVLKMGFSDEGVSVDREKVVLLSVNTFNSSMGNQKPYLIVILCKLRDKMEKLLP